MWTQYFNTNFIVNAEIPTEFNKPYRIWIACSEQVICTIKWTCVFSGNKTGFVRPGHIYNAYVLRLWWKTIMAK